MSLISPHSSNEECEYFLKIFLNQSSLWLHHKTIKYAQLNTISYQVYKYF